MRQEKHSKSVLGLLAIINGMHTDFAHKVTRAATLNEPSLIPAFHSPDYVLDCTYAGR